eukprot:TRINITY_DN33612_c0_g1_i1.p1 TRINITY_DN33612_c0_g1~~TRINITY_DN33612_c0_g1_i1.p1  ORF type:complete len:828 (+),score=121.11 TRINITY_DN33612_c0_g1_i1:17-2500(+)
MAIVTKGEVLRAKHTAPVPADACQMVAVSAGSFAAGVVVNELLKHHAQHCSMARFSSRRRHHVRDFHETQRHRSSEWLCWAISACTVIALRRFSAKLRLSRRRKSLTNLSIIQPEANTGKGKGKGKGKPPPPQSPTKAKGTGKSANLPLPGPKLASAKDVGEAPFGRRIHWVKPTFHEPGGDTIFAAFTSDASKAELDKGLLKAMFSEHMPKRSRTWSAPKPAGVSILDTARATNLAIMVKKLPTPLTEFCNCVEALDSTHPQIKAEHVELVINSMPNTYEVTKLMDYDGKRGPLRDIEKGVLPLCTLSTLQAKVLRVAMSHEQMLKNLSVRCKTVCDASEQVRTSCQLRELLSLILQAGNYINSGDEAGSPVKAFGIESLQSMATFKVGPISALHFLCISVKHSTPNFLAELQQGLCSVRLAAKEKLAYIQSEVEVFANNVEAAVSRLCQLPSGGSEVLNGSLTSQQLNYDRLGMLVAELQHEHVVIRSNFSAAVQSAGNAQAYFTASSVGRPNTEGTSMKAEGSKVKHGNEDCERKVPLQGWHGHLEVVAEPQMPSDVFFGHISGFLDMFRSTWLEIERQPAKWKKFEDALAVKSCKSSGAAGWARQLSRQLSRQQSRQISQQRCPTSEQQLLDGTGLTSSDDECGHDSLKQPLLTPSSKAQIVKRAPRKLRSNKAHGSPTVGQAFVPLIRVVPPSGQPSKRPSVASTRSPSPAQITESFPTLAARAATCAGDVRLHAAWALTERPAARTSWRKDSGLVQHWAQNLCEFHVLHDSSSDESEAHPKTSPRRDAEVSLHLKNVEETGRLKPSHQAKKSAAGLRQITR